MMPRIALCRVALAQERVYSVEPYRMCYYRTSVDVRPFQSTNSQHPFIKAILTVLLEVTHLPWRVPQSKTIFTFLLGDLTSLYAT
jgi:hypothetical protein